MFSTATVCLFELLSGIDACKTEGERNRTQKKEQLTVRHPLSQLELLLLDDRPLDEEPALTATSASAKMLSQVST